MYVEYVLLFMIGEIGLVFIVFFMMVVLGWIGVQRTDFTGRKRKSDTEKIGFNIRRQKSVERNYDIDIDDDQSCIECGKRDRLMTVKYSNKVKFGDYTLKTDVDKTNIYCKFHGSPAFDVRNKLLNKIQEGSLDAGNENYIGMCKQQKACLNYLAEFGKRSWENQDTKFNINRIKEISNSKDKYVNMNDRLKAEVLVLLYDIHESDGWFETNYQNHFIEQLWSKLYLNQGVEKSNAMRSNFKNDIFGSLFEMVTLIDKNELSRYRTINREKHFDKSPKKTNVSSSSCRKTDLNNDTDREKEVIVQRN